MSTTDEAACTNGPHGRPEGHKPKPQELTLSVGILDRENRSRRRKRWGVAAVEFAVVVPVFLLLLLGMIEFGRAIMVQQMLTNASREGARLGVLDGTTTAQVRTTVENYLTTIEGETTAVNPDPPGNAGFGQPVSVTVSVGFDQVSWLSSPMFLGGRNLSATTVMRRESVQ